MFSQVSVLFGQFHNLLQARRIRGRYNPNEFVTTLDDGSILRNEIPYEHTKNRYPWLCSLRDKDTRKKHHCGATLLR